MIGAASLRSFEAGDRLEDIVFGAAGERGVVRHVDVGTHRAPRPRAARDRELATARPA